MKRFVLVAAVAAAAVGVAAGALASARSGSSRGLHVASVGPLHVQYPASFDLRYFASCAYGVVGVKGQCVHGVVMGSYRLGSSPELGASGAYFRASGVAFELVVAAKQRGVIAPYRLPQRLKDYHAVGRRLPVTSTSKSAPEQWEAFFRANGVNYWAIAWIGTHSTKQERAQLRSLISSLSTQGANRSPVCTRGLVTVEADPRHLLPLTANPIGPASQAALRYTRLQSKPQVVSADLATVDHERGGEAKFDCGSRVWRRTVVVYITLRAFKNSASLSENVFFVGRFKNGYRVWQVVH